MITPTMVQYSFSCSFSHIVIVVVVVVVVNNNKNNLLEGNSKLQKARPPSSCSLVWVQRPLAQSQTQLLPSAPPTPTPSQQYITAFASGDYLEGVWLGGVAT